MQREEEGNRSVIDREGKEVIPPKYDSVASFRDGLICVTLGDRWEEYTAPGISQGQRLVPGKMIYLDRKGKVAWEAEE